MFQNALSVRLTRHVRFDRMMATMTSDENDQRILMADDKDLCGEERERKRKLEKARGLLSPEELETFFDEDEPLKEVADNETDLE